MDETLLQRPLTRRSEVSRPLVLVQPGANPSAAYYLRERIGAASCCTANLRARHADVPALDGHSIVFCRYVNRAWAERLRRARGRVGRIALFVDDDLDELLRTPGVPYRYRWRVWHRHQRHRAALRELVDEVWTSTEVLAARWSGWTTRVLPPIPPTLPPLGRRPDRPPTLAFHATAQHRAELDWLLPVLEGVLRAVPEAVCEIRGLGVGERRLRRLPRTRVLPQLPWPAYAADPGSADVAVAPLVPNRLNAARSHTKLFDIARLGAAAVVATGSSYAGPVRHGEDALCLPLDHATWIEAVSELLRAPSEQARLARALHRTLAARRARLLRAPSPLERDVAQVSA